MEAYSHRLPLPKIKKKTKNKILTKQNPITITEKSIYSAKVM